MDDGTASSQSNSVVESPNTKTLVVCCPAVWSMGMYLQSSDQMHDFGLISVNNHTRNGFPTDQRQSCARLAICLIISLNATHGAISSDVIYRLRNTTTI
mmetsp:Transcript_1149/g.2971  ORF Transcript_1149/g.2971 Transcript_1149/m.2971 type:complete len:99 (-) Transcript_1149:472-768(-)